MNYTTRTNISTHGKNFDEIRILHRKQDGVSDQPNDLNKPAHDIQQHTQKPINKRVKIANLKQNQHNREGAIEGARKRKRGPAELI
ncbi:MAG: hypothetical protein AOA66_0444 [Candidatus Bathyarchaeota archaeon BA2]|nr:MAG: hypothetical protein AOA66_0444 [Candidatus Bathyarchaeota archaeon BA2]